MTNIQTIYVATTFVLGAMGPSSNPETEGLIYAAWVGVDANNQIVAREYESYDTERVSQLEMEAEALLSALDWAARRGSVNVTVYSASQPLVDSLRQQRTVVHQTLLKDVLAAQRAINARLEWVDPAHNVAAHYLSSYITGNQGLHLN